MFRYLGIEGAGVDAVLPYGGYHPGRNFGTLSWNYNLNTSACVRCQEVTGMHRAGKVSSCGCLLAAMELNISLIRGSGIIIIVIIRIIIIIIITKCN
jgi:hypothetical protein